MKIKFQYTSQISMLANCDEETIEVIEQATIQNAIEKLLSNKSEEFKNLLISKTGFILPAILLIRNGTQINFIDNETLNDRDEILIFSPMSGG
jgi:molybdopterin converting factor small subunit